nr:MAG: hypothetical protein DIU68_01910 [Chloroflexota bacterium]
MGRCGGCCADGRKRCQPGKESVWEPPHAFLLGD